MNRSTRREWLRLCGAGAAVALAGCSDGDDGGSGMNSIGGDDADGGDDGGTDGSAAGDDGGDGADSGSGDGGSGDGPGGGSGDGSGGDGSGGDGADGSDDGDGGGASADELDLTPPTSYAFEGESSMTMEEQVFESSFSGYVNEDGDWYQEDTVETFGMEFREVTARIGDTTYFSDEMSGCETEPGWAAGDPEGTGLYTYDEFYDGAVDILGSHRAVGTDTFEGQSVRVYEFDLEDMSEVWSLDEDLFDEATETIYVSLGEDRIVGTESTFSMDGVTSESVTRFHSFGDEFTVEPPEGC